MNWTMPIAYVVSIIHIITTHFTGIPGCITILITIPGITVLPGHYRLAGVGDIHIMAGVIQVTDGATRVMDGDIQVTDGDIRVTAAGEEVIIHLITRVTQVARLITTTTDTEEERQQEEAALPELLMAEEVNQYLLPEERQKKVQKPT